MATVLQEIVEKKHYSFIDGKDVTWQEAVRLSALPLVADGSVSEDYYKQIAYKPCEKPLYLYICGKAACDRTAVIHNITLSPDLVSHTSDSLDVFRVRDCFKLLTDISYIYIHYICLAEVVIAPDLFKELFAGKHDRYVLKQRFKQSEFL